MEHVNTNFVAAENIFRLQSYAPLCRHSWLLKVQNAIVYLKVMAIINNFWIPDLRSKHDSSKHGWQSPTLVTFWPQHVPRTARGIPSSPQTLLYGIMLSNCVFPPSLLVPLSFPSVHPTFWINYATKTVAGKTCSLHPTWKQNTFSNRNIIIINGGWVS